MLSKSSGTIACAARLCLRKYRETGDRLELERHEIYKGELARRGYTDQFGILGWDDALSSEEWIRRAE